MGGSYGNITVKGVTQDAVVEALRGRRAIVTPNLHGCVVVFTHYYDDESADDVRTVTSELTLETGSAALAIIVHDDDILWYYLYQNGNQTGTYCSNPFYFDLTGRTGGPTGGDAGKLCAAFGVNLQKEVETVLRQSNDAAGFVFQTERHEALVKLLGLPPISVGNALESFIRGDLPADNMIWVPAPP
jgi:hypothetical protein